MVFYVGDTIRSQCAIYDYDAVMHPDGTITGTPINPDTFDIEVYDPLGNLKATYNTATKINSGVYFVSHNTSRSDAAGTWRFVWTVVSGGITDSEEATAIVHER